MLSDPRLTLILLLAMSKNLTWIVEQPQHSLLQRHKRFEWMMNHVCYATKLHIDRSVLLKAPFRGPLFGLVGPVQNP